MKDKLQFLLYNVAGANVSMKTVVKDDSICCTQKEEGIDE
jgi:hypothetical protein